MLRRSRPLLVTPPSAGGAVVRPVRFAGDALLVRGILERDAEAIEAFHDRYATHVVRILARIVGGGVDLRDLQHDVFVRALGSIGTLQDPTAVRAWITSVAVLTAKGYIQRRARRSWLRFLAPEDVPEVEAATADDEVQEALRCTYLVLDRLPVEERVAFALRFIEGMELADVARACGVSLATIKRRLARAEARFAEHARRHPVLADWIEGGSRWGAATP